jgi:hypothetical protein
MKPIPVHLAVEDELSEAILRKVIEDCRNRFAVEKCFRKGGNSYLRKSCLAFNRASRFTPFIMLTDLDMHLCAPELIRNWLPEDVNPYFEFRVAVREVESWLMADRDAFASFAGVRSSVIPLDLDSVPDPKRFLFQVLSASRKRQLARDIIPDRYDSRKVGRAYNARLVGFVRSDWHAIRAQVHSDSLRRAVHALEEFKWPNLSKVNFPEE